MALLREMISDTFSNSAQPARQFGQKRLSSRMGESLV
jgi:hypothetical protein